MGMSTLEPGILEVLRKANRRDPETELSVQTIAEKIAARTGWVSRALAALAKEGKVVRTRDGDDDGRGPFYRLLTLETVPEKMSFMKETEAQTTITLQPQISFITPGVCERVEPQPSTGPSLRPLSLLTAIEDIANRGGFTVTYAEFLSDTITLRFVNQNMKP